MYLLRAVTNGAGDSAGRTAGGVQGRGLRRWRRRDEGGDWLGKRDAACRAALGRRPASARWQGRADVLGGMAGFQPVCGHRVHSVSYLQLEGVKGPLQDQVWPIVQRRQRRLDAVMADQYESGEQEILGQSGVGRHGVMRRGQRDAASQ
jgi:hypothetical protein